MPFDPDQYLQKKASPQSSGFNPDAYLQKKQVPPAETPSLLAQAGNGLLSGISAVGEKIDRFTGAPVRAAIGSLQNDMTDLGGAARAYGKQFGAPAAQAPTGQEIVEKAGVPRTALSDVLPSLYSEKGKGLIEKGGMLDPTASGVAGLAMNVAADPTALLPVGKIIGARSKLAESMGTKIAEGASKAAQSAGIYVSKKLGNLISGVPEKEIETYIKHYPDVQKLINQYGDRIPEAADKIREGFQTSIRSKSAELGGKIKTALSSLPDEKNIELKPILDAIETVKGRVNATLRPEEIKEMEDTIGRLKAVAGDSNKLTPTELNDIKGFLQDRGSAAYMRDGQIFVPGKQAQIAAKNAGAIARKSLNAISPEIAEANNALAQLHVVEGKMNKNLLAPGTPEGALLAAGSGVNPRNIRNLQRLTDITGANVIGDAEKLSAAKRFSNPGLHTTDTTGKSAERLAKAGALGYWVGGAPGAAVGAAMTSPLALKSAIQTGKAAQGLIGSPATLPALEAARLSSIKKKDQK